MTSSSNPLVSIVIVNWNGLEDTKLCLEHTRKQTYKNTEIIIVDNGSVDNSLEFLRQQKDIKLVINKKNLGFTGGHIAGYKAAEGDFILLLNNDAVMDVNYVKIALKDMLADDSIAALGGRAYFWNKENPLFDVTNDFYAYQNINPITGEGIFTQHDSGVIQEVNNVSGSCVMIRRNVIDRIGYLHDPFFAYYEESDLFARMKRSGYKIMYSPSLAIWHANGKSSNRKAPTFAYYMMMRNRFRFAVRNFDNWSLKRFLNFYLKMGIVSILKSILPGEQRPMHRAYARAFAFNLLHGWQSFRERRALMNFLGDTSYNELIVAEQTGISVIVNCKSKQDLENCSKLAVKLGPLTEIIMVVSDPKLTSEAKQISSKIESSSLRQCIDTGLFKAHSINIGAVCAKNDWLLIADSKDLNISVIRNFLNIIYKLNQTSKRIALLSDTEISSVETALESTVGSSMLISKSLFIEAGGLLKQLSVDDALRALLSYATLETSILSIASSTSYSHLPSYNYASLSLDDLYLTISLTYQDVINTKYKVTHWDKLTARFYRLAQVTYLTKWLLTKSISLHLKIARLKNLVIAIIKLNRVDLANELKHIRNEVIRGARPILDLKARKDLEIKQLEYLRKHPEETAIFIIVRDRYEPLSKLLKWFEEQKLNRIILIDNDSALPALTDYLNETSYQVLEMGRNPGHKVAWEGGIIKLLVPDEFYLLTDPDVIPVLNSPKVVTHLYDLHTRFSHLKIGLGLKIDDLPDHYVLKDEVIQWESQFWKTELSQGVYEAGLDTTFALYKPYTYNYFIHPSIRTGEPYVARHLPWYKNPDKFSEEDTFYRLRADQNVNTWDKDKLPERYAKELAKQRH
jgi:GT2 family glycosyltransferase